jgi:hypothetical protein
MARLLCYLAPSVRQNDFVDDQYDAGDAGRDAPRLVAFTNRHSSSSERMGQRAPCERGTKKCWYPSDAHIRMTPGTDRRTVSSMFDHPLEEAGMTALADNLVCGVCTGCRARARPAAPTRACELIT